MYNIDDVDSFAIPVGTGMHTTEHPPLDPAASAALTARLREFDAVRTRGAIEARTAPGPRPAG